MPHRTVNGIALAFFVGPLSFVSTAAAAPQRMTFRNNLIPGHLTKHHLVRTIRRTTRKPDYVETLVYEQRGSLIQCNIDEPRPGNIMLYQMAADEPARVVRLFHDAEAMDKVPAATALNLPRESTRLHSATMTPRDAPVQAPLADPVQNTVLTALLDFAHWPAKKIDAGHRWERTFHVDGFDGRQVMEFVDLVRIEGEVTARIRLTVEGKFTGPLERDWEFDKAQALIYWRRLDRALAKMRAEATWRRRRPGGDEDYEMKFTASLADLEQIDADAQELVRVQLTVFSQAWKALREKNPRDAIRLCREFRAQWPRSMWLPAVADLEQQAAPKTGGPRRFKTAEIKAILAKTIIALEAARQKKEYDLIEASETLLRQLADDYRFKLNRLVSGDDDTIRSQAVFALAFSERPEDLHRVVHSVGDRSHRVRAMALAGLAARRVRDLDVQPLIKSLDDEKPSVRLRACQAVAACVAPEHYSVVKIVEKLDHLMVHDESAGVRREAVRALAAVGAPADVSRLQRALNHELNQGNRREIERAIETLQARE